MSQPMRNDITLKHHLSLAGHIHKMISVIITYWGKKKLKKNDSVIWGLMVPDADTIQPIGKLVSDSICHLSQIVRYLLCLATCFFLSIWICCPATRGILHHKQKTVLPWYMQCFLYWKESILHYSGPWCWHNLGLPKFNKWGQWILIARFMGSTWGTSGADRIQVVVDDVSELNNKNPHI